jgi:sec-independent protein translocase protein TatC
MFRSVSGFAMNKQAAAPLPDPDDMFADSRMSMGDHIEELRTHLVRAIYGFAVGLFVSFFIGQWVMKNWISKPVEDQLMLYWQRYNERQLEPTVDLILNRKSLTLPRYRFDKFAFADAFEVQGETGKPIGKLRPLRGAILAPENAFVNFWKECMGLDAGVNLSGERWILLEPDARDFVRSMQEFNLAVHPPTLATMAPQEAFVVFLKVCMLVGLIISCPWVFYQIWTFVAAGLYPHEKRLVNVYLPYSIGLFLVGVFLCQFLVIPKAVAGLLWFNEWLGLQPDFRLNEWLSFAILMPLVFGVSFQTPLAMLFAYTIGAFEIEAYRKFRGIAYFLIAVFAAIILPTPDVLSMVMLFGPMWLLYELGIFLCLMQPRTEWEDADSQSQELIEV